MNRSVLCFKPRDCLQAMTLLRIRPLGMQLDLGECDPNHYGNDFQPQRHGLFSSPCQLCRIIPVAGARPCGAAVLQPFHGVVDVECALAMTLEAL